MIQYKKYWYAIATVSSPGTPLRSIFSIRRKIGRTWDDVYLDREQFFSPTAAHAAARCWIAEHCQ